MIVHPHEVRARIALAATQHQRPAAALSRVLGRPPGYMARYLRGGSPFELAASERSLLSDFLGLDPRRLGLQPDAATGDDRRLG